MENFSDWLASEMTRRGISASDLARAAHKAPAVITRVLRGERKPAPETLEAIAGALRLPTDEVFRAAGLLPAVSEVDAIKRQILFETQSMTREEQREVLAYIRMKKELRQEEAQQAPSASELAKNPNK
jgi:transcriptional regulator with XRE-family HTH domain